MSDVDTTVAGSRTELLEPVASLNASRGTQTVALMRRVSGAKEALTATSHEEVAALTNTMMLPSAEC